MKKLFLSVLLLVGLAATVQAQTSYRVVTLGSYTNLAQAGTNVAYILDVRGSQYVSLMVSSTNDASATDAIGIPIFRSVDGSTFDTTATWNILLAANGTTRVNTTTNLAVFGCGYLKIPYTTNAAATANAVITLKYSLKTGL